MKFTYIFRRSPGLMILLLLHVDSWSGHILFCWDLNFTLSGILVTSLTRCLLGAFKKTPCYFQYIWFKIATIEKFLLLSSKSMIGALVSQYIKIIIIIIHKVTKTLKLHLYFIFISISPNLRYTLVHSSSKIY